MEQPKKTGGIMQDLRDKIIEFVKHNGPVLPVRLAKAIDKDIRRYSFRTSSWQKT